MTAIGVIPARHASTRFPGKPLALLAGKPMIQWVHERVARAKTLQRVLVATDDERIRGAVAAFGGEAVLTSPLHASGAEWVAEAIEGLEEREGLRADVIVNVQGDEPLVESESIDALVNRLSSDPSADLVTLATPLEDEAAFHDPNVVKVVRARDGRALYFSRAPIPWAREGGKRPGPRSAFRHVGLYAYRREALRRFCASKPSELEELEALEQLRALQDGAVIQVLVGRHVHLAVDRPEDLAPVEAVLREQVLREASETKSGAPAPTGTS